MQPAHPALSLRPLLTSIDSSISDAWLEMLYNCKSPPPDFHVPEPTDPLRSVLLNGQFLPYGTCVHVGLSAGLFCPSLSLSFLALTQARFEACTSSSFSLCCSNASNCSKNAPNCSSTCKPCLSNSSNYENSAKVTWPTPVQTVPSCSAMFKLSPNSSNIKGTSMRRDWQNRVQIVQRQLPIVQRLLQTTSRTPWFCTTTCSRRRVLQPRH